MPARRSGFTLLEICLALMIGLLLITLAVPSISGMLAEQRLKQSFDAFDGFVRRAKERSMSERRAYVMVWDDEGITLATPEPRETDDPEAEVERFIFQEGQTLTLQRTAALMKKPVDEWVFWRSGTCEPVAIAYEGAEGSWSVQYDPLTVRATFLDSEVK